MKKNLNLSLPRLKALAKASAKTNAATRSPNASKEGAAPDVFVYVTASTRLDEAQRLRQRGSGPNFGADLITLTTCKHRMRAALGVEEWPGQWIVGLTSSGLHEGRQWLFFATQIERAYASHAELARALPQPVREAKSSRLHVHGDLFEPLRHLGEGEALDPANYHAPRDGHRHEAPERWHRDIHHATWQRPAALLVGDPARSFLWTEPILFYRGQLTQGYKKWPSLSEFVRELAAAR